MSTTNACNDSLVDEELATDATPLLSTSLRSEGDILSETEINIVHPSSADIDIDIDVAAHKKTIIGMVCVGVGTAFIGMGGSIVAFMSDSSVLEIMLGRYWILMLLSIALWIIKKPPECNHWYGDKSDRLNIWIRGLLYFVLVFGWYRGLQLVPIGDAECIIFISPILIVLIARFVLKEHLSILFPLSFLLTIIGILMVAQPEFIFGSLPTTGAVAQTRSISIVGLCFLFIMSICWAITSILVRTAQNAHWLQIQMVANVQGSLLWTPLCILLNRFVFESDTFAGDDEWTLFSAADGGKTIGLIAGCSLCGFIGLSLNVIGYQMGDATKVAWMEYFDLIFAYMFQWVWFHQRPNIWEWIGLVCLMSTCGVHLVEEIIKYKQSKAQIINEQEIAETLISD